MINIWTHHSKSLLDTLHTVCGFAVFLCHIEGKSAGRRWMNWDKLSLCFTTGWWQDGKKTVISLHLSDSNDLNPELLVSYTQLQMRVYKTLRFFFLYLLAGMTKPRTPIRDNRYQDSGYQPAVFLLFALHSLYTHKKRGVWYLLWDKLHTCAATSLS